MEKIHNLLYYTNVEIGLVRDDESANAQVEAILKELHEMHSKIVTKAAS